jgi:polyisoprenoid-binding protein YceI
MRLPFFRKYLISKMTLLVFYVMMIESSFGQMHPVAKESSIVFTIHNFGFKVTGSLEAPQGDIRFNPDSLPDSYFKMTIKSASVNTDNNTRDEHLREEEYFDVKNYPLISFVSASIQAAGNKGNFTASGKLTVKNNTKDIQLPFTAVKTGDGYLFTGNFKMNRRDFGVGGGSTLSNELTVDIKVLAR